MSQARPSSREAQCAGKVAYRTKRDAKDAVRLRQHKAGGRLVAYRCPWCDGWHVGHGRTEWGAVNEEGAR